MPAVTIVEAKNLLEQIEEKIYTLKRLMNKFVFEDKNYDMPVCQETEKASVEIVADKVEVKTDNVSKEETVSGALEDMTTIQDQIDKLYLDRNKIKVAMLRFKSTEKFNI